MATMQDLDIKKVNQQLIELSRIEPYDSPNTVTYATTIQQLGLSTHWTVSKQTGKPVLQIDNSKANRDKIPAKGLSNTIATKGGKTAKEVRRDVQKELKSQGKKADAKSVTREMYRRQIWQRVQSEFNLIPSDTLYEPEGGVWIPTRIHLELQARIRELDEYVQNINTPDALIDSAVQEVIDEIRQYQDFYYDVDDITSAMQGD